MFKEEHDWTHTFEPLMLVRISGEAQVVHDSRLFVRLQVRQLVGQLTQVVPFLVVPEGQEEVQTPFMRMLEELAQEEHSKLLPP